MPSKDAYLDMNTPREHVAGVIRSMASCAKQSGAALPVGHAASASASVVYGPVHVISSVAHGGGGCGGGEGGGGSGALSGG